MTAPSVNFIFNIAKGSWAYYASLPATNDALVIVPIETTGIETDEVLADYDNLQALLAASNNEQTTMGRKTVTATTITVDDVNNLKDADFADITWTTPTGNAISALVVCYDPDTTAGTDADLIPLSKHQFVTTPNGSDLTAVLNTAGFARAQ